MKQLALAAVLCATFLGVALVSVAGLVFAVGVVADKIPDHVHETAQASCADGYEVEDVGECQLAEPSPSTGSIRVGRQYRVNCASMDGGAPTNLLRPMDGGAGTGSVDIKTDSIYVAPIVGSTVNVRVGFADREDITGNTELTINTGFAVGTSGRDGVGVTIDTTESPLPRCISSGAAQQVDVITGRE